MKKHQSKYLNLVIIIICCLFLSAFTIKLSDASPQVFTYEANDLLQVDIENECSPKEIVYHNITALDCGLHISMTVYNVGQDIDVPELTSESFDNMFHQLQAALSQ